jgi:ssDNA-binding replication factor A large subunit
MKGDTIQVRNASVSTYKGERQLRLGKNGTLSVLQSRGVAANQEPEAMEKGFLQTIHRIED